VSISLSPTSNSVSAAAAAAAAAAVCITFCVSRQMKSSSRRPFLSLPVVQ
jgi:hypothetical protein